MSATRDVTGGDLNDLWRAANVALPSVSNVYARHLEATEVSGDTEKYGAFYEPWAQLAATLAKAMGDTQESLHESAAALNGAVDAYAYVDGDTSQRLSTAGQQLHAIVDSNSGAVDSPEGHENE